MIKIFFEKLLSLIYTRCCFYCNSSKDDKFLCEKCYKKINFMPPSVMKKINGSDIYACTLYYEVIKKLISDLKYKQKKYLAKVLAELMFEYFKRLKIDKEYLVLSVPIHKNRKKERKYNHMDLVADEFCSLAGLKNNKNFLKRIKDTQKQFKLHKKEREINLKDAFDLNLKENVDKNEDLLIIDDITSTGTTFAEIINLLKQNGYNKITALALATPDIWNEQNK